MATQQQIKEDEKKLVIARLSTIPSNMGIALGGEGEFKRDELIKRIEENDEVGMKYVEMQLEFLRSLKEGSLFE